MVRDWDGRHCDIDSPRRHGFPGTVRSASMASPRCPLSSLVKHCLTFRSFVLLHCLVPPPGARLSVIDWPSALPVRIYWTSACLHPDSAVVVPSRFCSFRSTSSSRRARRAVYHFRLQSSPLALWWCTLSLNNTCTSPVCTISVPLSCSYFSWGRTVSWTASCQCASR